MQLPPSETPPNEPKDITPQTQNPQSKNKYLLFGSGVWIIIFFAPLIVTSIDKINNPDKLALFPERDLLISKVLLGFSIVLTLAGSGLMARSIKNIKQRGLLAGQAGLKQKLFGLAVGFAVAVGLYIFVLIAATLLVWLLRNT